MAFSNSHLLRVLRTCCCLRIEHLLTHLLKFTHLLTMLGMAASQTPPSSPSLDQLLEGISIPEQPQVVPAVSALPQHLQDAGWRTHISTREGREYFFNIYTRETRWSRPEIAVVSSDGPSTSTATSATIPTVDAAAGM